MGQRLSFPACKGSEAVKELQNEEICVYEYVQEYVKPVLVHVLLHADPILSHLLSYVVARPRPACLAGARDCGGRRVDAPFPHNLIHQRPRRKAGQAQGLPRFGVVAGVCHPRE